MYKKIKNYGLRFDKSILSWDEAIPIGNGKQGCLIYGDGPLRLSLDRIDLWDNRESQAVKSKEFSYKKLVECAKRGEEGWKEKARIFNVNYDYPYPTKLSAGGMDVFCGGKTDKVCSELDITTACATITKENFKLQTFMSATEFIGVMRVFGDYKLTLRIPDYFSGDENGEWSAPSGLVENDGTPEIIENGCLKYPRSQVVTDGEFTYYEQKTLTDYSFGVIVLNKKKDDCEEIYYSVITSSDSKNPIEYGKKLLLNAAEKGYDKLFVEHKRWWKKYWEKSEVSIPDKQLEKTYYFSWYLFASTSRKGFAPMPLQGVWTADNNALPPWNGDYHHDTNTQMSYWGYLKANRLEEGRVFADYLWSLRKTFEKYTKKVYGVNGYLLPGCSTLDGKFMGGCVHFSLAPTLSVWSAKAFDDYYRYTGDVIYLKNRAYPFFRGVAKAVSALLEERNGKLYLPVSASPEIYEGSYENFNIGNTNFDQSLILYLYLTLIDYCNILGEDKGEYEKILSKLDKLYVSDDKVLMLSETIKLPFSHRHFSHMMCVYPLNIIKYDTQENKKIIDNTIWEIEQLGTGWWVGFSFPWCATLYSHKYNGSAAFEKLRAFVKGFLSPNGFHLNGDYKKLGYSQWHYRPFTLEALFAYCDSVQEMLMQDHKGYIELFPALPDDWKDASIKNLLSRGGVYVSAKNRKGRIHSITVKSNKDGECVIKNNFALSGVFEVTNKTNAKFYSCSFGEVITVSLKKGNNVFKF